MLALGHGLLRNQTRFLAQKEPHTVSLVSGTLILAQRVSDAQFFRPSMGKGCGTRFPDVCTGLKATEGATAEICGEACCADPKCLMWQFSPAEGCFVGARARRCVDGHEDWVRRMISSY